MLVRTVVPRDHQEAIVVAAKIFNSICFVLFYFVYVMKMGISFTSSEKAGAFKV